MKMQILYRVVNIVTNGEIAHYEQFLHLPQSFQNTFAADESKCIYKWERVNLRIIFRYKFVNPFPHADAFQ